MSRLVAIFILVECCLGNEVFGPQDVTQNVCSFNGGHLEVRYFDCGKPCPLDWTTRSTSLNTGNTTGCPSGQFRSRCECDCEMAWYGTFPFCSGECPTGHVEIKRDKKPDGLWYQCLMGTKALCKTCKGTTVLGGQNSTLQHNIPPNNVYNKTDLHVDNRTDGTH